MILSQGTSVLVVAHDAGGAEIVSSWVARHPDYDYVYVLEGPAYSIFRRRNRAIVTKSRSELSALIRECDWVLTGTGSTDLEASAIEFAIRAGTPVAAYLDHWVNYPERFRYRGRLLRPDEIWVGDKYAEDLAKRSFPGQSIRLEENCYFREIAEHFGKRERPPLAGRGIRIVYFCEPRRRNVRDSHFSESEAIAYFFSRLAARASGAGDRVETVRMRLHPSEPAGKYDAFASDRGAIPVEISPNRDLLEDCRWADWAVGCSSMAMVVSLIAGLRVFSAIPPGCGTTVLPYSEIEVW